MRRLISSFTILLVLAAFGGVLAPPASAQDVALRRPVDAPVLDPFRLPDGPYGAGNRGIEYDTDLGDPVVAAAGGVVVFAGPVAGELHMTIDHGGGFRTSYSFVDQLRVSSGDEVRAGEEVAVAGDVFHFGARDQGVYVDPEPLFGVRQLEVRLVPHDRSDDWNRWLDLVEHSERQAFLDEFGAGGGRGFWAAVGAAIRVVSQLPIAPFRLLDPVASAEAARHMLDVLATLAENLDATQQAVQLAIALHMVAFPPPCTPAGVTARRAGGRRIAVLVDGLDSSSDGDGAMAGLDFDRHGYADSDQVRFSYRGGLVPGDGGEWGGAVGHSDYTSSDTRAEVEPMIDRLTETLRAVASANPGVPIDIYGHSLGGLVARHAIISLDLDAVPVGVAMTFAAPHGGAPSADFVESVEITLPGSLASIVLEEAWPDHVLVAPSIADMSSSGFAGDTADVAFPDEVHAVTVGARADVIVPASTASAPGARHVVVGEMNPLGAHGGLPAHPDVAREVALALAGLPPACAGAGERLLDVVVPAGIELAEHAASAGLLAVDMGPG